MNNLSRLKLLLGITDNSKDELLEYLLQEAEQMVKVELGQALIPQELDWLPIEIAVLRYRKLKSEGLSSKTIDVIAKTFEPDLFTPYRPLIDKYQKQNRKIKFI